MDAFILKHHEKVAATLSCFDRLMFKGHLPINHSRGMHDLLDRHGVLIRSFKTFVLRHSARLKAHAQLLAERAGRPYHYLTSRVRKDELARAIAQEDRVADGLICVLAAVEPCRSFNLAYGKGGPRLVPANRKCLTLYFYVMDREFGFMHIRLQTWFPFTIQVYVNGHEFLARKLTRHGLEYQRQGNAFTHLEDPRRAQRFANGLTRKNWPRILHRFARRVNPLLGDLLRGLQYYWVLDQSEYATDVLFHAAAQLRDLYPKLLRHATLCFSAEDVLTFLGRKLHGNFTGEVLNDYKRRQPGARIKHRMTSNWIKMYDKYGRILRVETVINRPDQFRVRRRRRRGGRLVAEWGPMRKGVANIHRYVEVALRANARYLDALSVVDDPRDGYRELRQLTRSVRLRDRPVRGFNPAAPADVALFRTVLRGEHCLGGFRNAEVRRQLFPAARTPTERRRASARVTRLLQRLHARRLVAKTPRARRWRVTDRGRRIMSAALLFHDHDFPQLLQQAA